MYAGFWRWQWELAVRRRGSTATAIAIVIGLPEPRPLVWLYAGTKIGLCGGDCLCVQSFWEQTVSGGENNSQIITRHITCHRAFLGDEL